ncbi:MAG: S4 domain-containing protein [Candidatus Anstonellales archaeon]
MAKKGNRRHLKRIATKKRLAIKEKKAKKFIMKPMPGRHNKDSTWSLLFLLRDKLAIAKTKKEAKYILNKGIVKVDGKVIKKLDYPIGLFDIINISGETYVIVLDKKGRLDVIKAKIDHKPLKIKNKVSIKPGLWQLTFHDGTTKLVKDNSIKVGYTVIYDLNKKEIKEIKRPEQNALCLITDGKHAGQIAKLEDIKDMQGKKLLSK